MLTTQQLATLKAAIVANGTANGYLQAGDAYSLQQWCNSAASPNFYVYRTEAQVADIFNNILWANFTPLDAPDGTAAWTNRALACQGKQFNLQTMLVGKSTIDASKNNLRAGLQDALSNLPSGAGGASLSGGWANVRDYALCRAATNAEKVFATGGSGANGQNAATMQIEGAIAVEDINKIIAGQA